MNAAHVRSDDLVVVVDGSEAKQGTFLPGSHVPVAAPSDPGRRRARRRADPAVEHRPRDRAPWSPSSSRSASCWIAIPEMRELG